MSRTPALGPLLRQLLASSCLLLLVACAEAPASSAGTVPAASPTQSPPALTTEIPLPRLDFQSWSAQFREEALSAGILPHVFDSAFAGISPDPGVIAADRSQPEFTRPVWEYLEGALSAQRVQSGKANLRRHAETLDSIEERYGVDRQTLVAIWGLESNFGRIMGNRSVIRSLATLAYEGRRPQFAHDQLLAALQILQSGDVQASRMTGSWAGAMGQTQFIPTTYHQHAVDFDGDGRRDIWDSTGDALASTAHYLKASGWRLRQPWGFEVSLPRGFDYAQADMRLRQSIREWRLAGVPIPASQGVTEQEMASLLLPAGHRGPAFLVLDNFRSILKYNNSTTYALAIGLLSERFQNRGQILASWPRDDRPLNRSERIELQERLARNGFDPGSADGIIGANTRRAVRSFQQQLGWPADGYPTHQLLQKLKDE